MPSHFLSSSLVPSSLLLRESLGHRVGWNSDTALNSYSELLGSNFDRDADCTVIFGDFLQTVQAIFGLISGLGADHTDRAV
jgi:hypothetical protein